ncbi:hypothetical protein JTE90_025937 [Oedothorax gibbosus]|uniref:Uncharacterized protein n=1 Tax=Oedothorax gibbosus TaxID=931172 RepID=A0AAV6UCP5_9ARAC|nr:hypothetical protein JTE90_025937 [Oedothorax gibbosus]
MEGRRERISEEPNLADLLKQINQAEGFSNVLRTFTAAAGEYYIPPRALTPDDEPQAVAAEPVPEPPLMETDDEPQAVANIPVSNQFQALAESTDLSPDAQFPEAGTVTPDAPFPEESPDAQFQAAKRSKQTRMPHPRRSMFLCDPGCPIPGDSQTIADSLPRRGNR